MLLGYLASRLAVQYHPPAPAPQLTHTHAFCPACPQAYGPAALTAGLTPGQRRQLAVWLGACSAWVFVLVVVGGITRLTRSGLSMTSWKFTGEKPPSTPVSQLCPSGGQGALVLPAASRAACLFAASCADCLCEISCCLPFCRTSRHGFALTWGACLCQPLPLTNALRPPPQEEWEAEFARYKQTPEYIKTNQVGGNTGPRCAGVCCRGWRQCVCVSVWWSRGGQHLWLPTVAHQHAERSTLVVACYCTAACRSMWPAATAGAADERPTCLFTSVPLFPSDSFWQGMTVEEFKFIYFWEWGHRMWGRALGEPSCWGSWAAACDPSSLRRLATLLPYGAPIT